MRVHAVASIVPGATGTVAASYSYDANGNMLTGWGRNVTWTSFDMVSEITQGTNSVAFTYDSEHARLRQVSSDGSTKTYLNDPVSGAMAERIVGASLSVTWNDYVMLGGEMIALKVSGATSQTRYFHKDHLGSIVALTDETGAVVERSSFDAWGQRRTPMGEDDPLYPGQSLTSQITRDYTGHEQLDSVGLVHMNGRIYEPVIGKMLSADPTVPNPMDGQAYNRYAYVVNNPLSLTDPSGFRPDESADRFGAKSMREQSARASEREAGDREAARANASDTAAYDGSDASKDGASAGDQVAAGGSGNQQPPGAVIRGGNCLGCGLPDPMGGPMRGYIGQAHTLPKATPKTNPSTQQPAATTPQSVKGPAPETAPPTTKVEIKGPYKRPSSATTRRQRASVQGQPCTNCGTTTPNQVANHTEPLVKEHYRTGTIDLEKMRSLNAVGPHCPTCSAQEGAAMARFSRQMKKERGFE